MASRPLRVIPKRRFSGLETRALRQAGSVSRLGYLKGFGSFGSAPAQPVPASWQTDPATLLALAKAASGGKQPLGRLGQMAFFRGFGLSPTATTVAEVVAPKAASAAASALVAGSAAGPIGLAAGAVIALALTIFQKQYFNVSDANAACATQEQVWQKYLAVQGHVAGRALGWPTMIVIWHGAVGAGLFPLNSQHLTFHEGTLNCAGTGTWSDSFLGTTLQGVAAGCSANNCMPDALKKFNASAVPTGTADAVYFVDSILLPMNASASIPWITTAATNPVVHQLLYDVADAFLAENNVASTAYVEYPATTTTATTTAATSTTVAPSTTAATSTTTAATPMTAFPGFDASITGTDARLGEAWSVTDSQGQALWTPSTPAGFFSAPYSGGTSKIQVAISGNSILGLRQDANGNWSQYTGTFDSTGLNVSGTEDAYSAASPAGASVSFTAQISSPATTAAAAGTTTPAASVGTTSLTASTMGEETSAAPSDVNVTVSSPAASTVAPVSSAPATSNTLLWVAIAGVGALGLILLMQHNDKRRR